MHFLSWFGALALGYTVLAQNATHCESGVCYVVNVPAATASSGSGDIFMQISGPSSMSWLGLGQGSSMSGSNIFIIYANAAGDNVTLAPRRGIGRIEPASGSNAEVTLLAGSGISNDMMTANIRCSNCDTWSGGSMSLTDSNSAWIYAYKSGPSIASDAIDASIRQHDMYGSISLDLSAAAGGSSTNPFSGVSGAASTETTSNSGSSSGGRKAPPSNFKTILITHGVLSSLAFVVFFPLGAIFMRLLNFKGLVWAHAGWMSFTYLIALAGMGMGVWIAVTIKYLDAYHSIIGLVVVGCLLFQPFLGLAHHHLYKRSRGPNVATIPHIWWGRIIVTLGIINGGLGLKLADNSRKGNIAYGVVAGFMWCLWTAVILIAFIRSRGKNEGETGEKVVGSGGSNNSNEQMRGSGSI